MKMTRVSLSCAILFLAICGRIFDAQADDTNLAVSSKAQWAKRRAAVVQAMQEVMGPLPGKEKRCPLDVKIEDETDCGSYVRRRITYASEPGSRVPAYLLVPKDVLDGKKKTPAILCLHGTNDVI